MSAIAEYDELGKEAFLANYGYGEARSYQLHHDGKLYDSKAIIGVAAGYLPSQAALLAADFSGGEQTVARRLRQLGFTVTSTRAPPWLRDEVILACELVSENGWRRLEAHDLRVQELSNLLQRLPLHPLELRGPKFRNPNGVSRKTVDIATQHPNHSGISTNGSALDREVLQDFLNRPDAMRATAQAIRTVVDSSLAGEFDDTLTTDEADVGTAEGRLLARRHLARERDPKLREKKVRSFFKLNGYIACEACGFDFESTYGARGSMYIECHHTVPLHASGETSTRLADLVLLCANCHRMIHRSAPWLTFNELKSIVRNQSQAT